MHVQTGGKDISELKALGAAPRALTAPELLGEAEDGAEKPKKRA